MQTMPTFVGAFTLWVAYMSTEGISSKWTEVYQKAQEALTKVPLVSLNFPTSQAKEPITSLGKWLSVLRYTGILRVSKPTGSFYKRDLLFTKQPTLKVKQEVSIQPWN